MLPRSVRQLAPEDTTKEVEALQGHHITNLIGGKVPFFDVKLGLESVKRIHKEIKHKVKELWKDQPSVDNPLLYGLFGCFSFIGHFDYHFSCVVRFFLV